MAVLGTPSSLITPRYIPEQFNGIETTSVQRNQFPEDMPRTGVFMLTIPLAIKCNNPSAAPELEKVTHGACSCSV
jgi:hypothetical protein